MGDRNCLPDCSRPHDGKIAFWFPPDRGISLRPDPASDAPLKSLAQVGNPAFRVLWIACGAGVAPVLAEPRRRPEEMTRASSDSRQNQMETHVWTLSRAISIPVTPPSTPDRSWRAIPLPIVKRSTRLHPANLSFSLNQPSQAVAEWCVTSVCASARTGPASVWIRLRSTKSGAGAQITSSHAHHLPAPLCARV